MRPKAKKVQITTAILRVSKQGIQKLVFIPRSMEKIQYGDRVLIMLVTPEMDKDLLGMPKRLKIPWIDYTGRARYTE